MSSFYVYTFGCRCNQADSAAIRDGLSRSSMREAESPAEAGLVVVNTCTVTHRTDQQVRQMVRRMHRENQQARIVVTGCYAERDPEALAGIPGVRLVVGNADRERLPAILEEDAASSGSGRIIRSPLDQARDYLMAPASGTGGKTRPFVKIQDGCDARCSYCVIPTVRGPGRSARPEDILAEIRSLIRDGYREVVLTGVHLGTYGRKLEDPVRLLDLLRRILDLPGLGRLRLSSIEPMRFHRGIIRLAAENPAFAPHFHIPLQSGSDRILRRMRRPYTAGRSMDLLRAIREALPTAGIGTDLIVGFPGETEDDFEATRELISQSPLTYVHVFPFSARDGTDAFRMPHPVPPPITRERSRVLRELAGRKNREFRLRFAGRVLPAISLAKEEDQGEGIVLTENYIHARVIGPRPAPNRLLRVRIEQVRGDATTAAVVGGLEDEAGLSRKSMPAIR